LADIDPCALLSASDASSLGLNSPGTPDTVGSSKACDWTATSYALIVNLTAASISSLPNSTPTQIGSHQAVQQQNSGDGCTVALAVTSSSRVEVNATSTDTAQQCSEALNAAKLVEPHLPAS
jgi:hypothetical protein